eukprot:CAMPEP_0178455298 /NCGR_PEP_ID=MMETSP0689_2-20121128/45833_1 /TAXON_ID=160604 /ORGANISM="Amphidinium massartii, Strain CS-259" /LENGTH=96 /DNA_ID=CAMNT_0020081321 /DNA_START=559 /DNA_END=849 /DNA_ORIENTATION=+
MTNNLTGNCRRCLREALPLCCRHFFSGAGTGEFEAECQSHAHNTYAQSQHVENGGRNAADALVIQDDEAPYERHQDDGHLPYSLPTSNTNMPDRDN